MNTEECGSQLQNNAEQEESLNNQKPNKQCHADINVLEMI
jgi:hypothetical protein